MASRQQLAGLQHVKVTHGYFIAVLHHLAMLRAYLLKAATLNYNDSLLI